MYLCFFTLNLGSRTFTYRNKYRICDFLNYQTCSPTAGFHLHTTSGTFNLLQKSVWTPQTHKLQWEFSGAEKKVHLPVNCPRKLKNRYLYSTLIKSPEGTHANGLTSSDITLTSLLLHPQSFLLKASSTGREAAAFILTPSLNIHVCIFTYSEPEGRNAVGRPCFQERGASRGATSSFTLKIQSCCPQLQRKSQPIDLQIKSHKEIKTVYALLLNNSI